MTSSIAPTSEANGQREAASLTTPREGEQGRRRLPLLEQYLREQQSLTAVERFAQRHSEASVPAQERYYRALLPTSPPAPGQQYAFRVDLDACTGCKACVTACHNLNGLDEGETWRAVGLLHGGTTAAPVRQSVTTACHHCLDPACMNGCPVGAYEKDPRTGIVKHLDDQCIGCQYCTFTCPYDVPQYNPKLGIVRKCDMCTGRLDVGEAPACVQSCPNEAIAITLVDKQQALEDAQGDAFVPGAPSPGITVPTTVYATERALPRNLLPANFYNVKPAHRHVPLVVMLVLTQLSVGAFCVDALAQRALAPAAAHTLESMHSLIAVAIGLLALGASVLHLGRPQYAFRAFIGLRTSWMSREILAFGLFAPLAMAYASACFGRERLGELLGDAGALRIVEALRDSVAASGIAGIVCSILIYQATRRSAWSASITGFKFMMTAVILGLATTILTFSVGSSALYDEALRPPVALLVGGLARVLMGASALKAFGELIFLRHLRDKRYTQKKRTAALLTRDLAGHTAARFAALAVGGLLLPLGCLSGAQAPLFAGGSFVFLLVAELIERSLFFAAASSPGMPGGLD
jgi:Fe-S-cluster-containing dehydrogenase component/DMSO reductase anchor subunit